jgi:hypothetical protein
MAKAKVAVHRTATFSCFVGVGGYLTLEVTTQGTEAGESSTSNIAVVPSSGTRMGNRRSEELNERDALYRTIELHRS